MSRRQHIFLKQPHKELKILWEKLYWTVVDRKMPWSHGNAGVMGSARSSEQGQDSPPFDGQHHTQENDDEHEEASDHTCHLHRVVDLLLWLHSVRILGGSTLGGKQEEEDVRKAHT